MCIGVGGSVGREGPIVQIGSSLASSLGQWMRMPENRLRILVACGAAGGIAATFNAPITGVFFGVEIILREFSIEAIFTVMLSAMVADVISQPVPGQPPRFCPASRPVSPCTTPHNYLLIALLAVIAGLIGVGFKTVLYKIEDLCDRVWKRPPGMGPPGGGRGRPGSAAAGRAPDVRGRLPGHGQGRRRQLCPVVSDRPGRDQDDRHAA